MLTIMTVVLAGYVTTKAGWFTAKRIAPGAPLKTLQVRDASHLDAPMAQPMGSLAELAGARVVARPALDSRPHRQNPRPLFFDALGQRRTADRKPDSATEA